MAAKVGAKGGLQRKRTAQQGNIARWLRQLPSPPPQGIRLLPSEKFTFEEQQRQILSKVLGKPRPVADPFLDKVEVCMSDYLTFRLRQKRASAPADLYYKLARIRGKACSLVEALEEVNLSPGAYSPDGAALATILAFEARDAGPHYKATARSIDVELRDFVTTIDAVLSGKLPEIEEKLCRSRLSALTRENIFDTWRLTVMREYHQKIKTSRGAPKAVAMRQAIRQVVLDYETAFGETPHHSPATPFFRFLHRVLNYAQPQNPESMMKHRDLISDVLAELAESE